jgi:ElaB/YqjD/DUF883 family membrane-anchored ribosome-binding protein
MAYSNDTLNGAKKTLGSRLHALRDEFGDKSHELSRSAKAQLARANEGFRTAAHEVSDRSRRYAGYAHDRAAERPLVSIGAAAGIGLLVGFLLSRRYD